MPLHREVKIVRRHATAVIDDPDQPPSPGLDGDLDGTGPGIDGILDQLLHGRGGTLNDFAGRDAIDEHGVEATDGRRGQGGGHRHGE